MPCSDYPFALCSNPLPLAPRPQHRQSFNIHGAAPFANPRRLFPSSPSNICNLTMTFHLMPAPLLLPPLILMPCFLISFIAAQLPNESSLVCPLNFTIFDGLDYLKTDVKSSTNVTKQCIGFTQALHVVLVEYAATTGFFVVPDESASTCWSEFDAKLEALGISVDVRSSCNLTTNYIAASSTPCGNITSSASLESVVPESTLRDASDLCATASYADLSICVACTNEVLRITVTDLPGISSSSSINSCQDTVAIYVASSSPNPSRSNVAACLFNILPPSTGSGSSRLKYIYGSISAAIVLIIILGLLLFLYIRHKRHQASRNREEVKEDKHRMTTLSCSLVWFSIDEIKEATGNFSRHNIIGTGKFGNVFRGKLEDGSEIAVKRLKNCSPSGDDEFFHELEVISTVKHRNLVALIGGCVNKTEREGHQRIIVYEYVSNGCLYDHLFVNKTTMDWPRRQNIALGIVRGLTYLHKEVQPAIIHRDIKASNILLDANWNAKVADFGLAKFRPEDATHLTTRVAGTQGYVAPEYVLYGQLTEKSDVYSFGILLLELLTGQKIFKLGGNAQGSMLITDWAWSMVKQGKVMDVLDPDMGNLGSPDVLERYILLALLCSHPQVPFRPTLDEVLKIMESDQPLPALPDRPVPYTINITELDQEASSASTIFYSFSSMSLGTQ